MIQAFGLTSDSRKDLPPAVDDVTFEAHAGRVTALLGTVGAGKTTTLRLMLELQQGRGITYFRGRPLHRISHPSREVGVLLGDVPGHPSRTVRGHLRMLCAASGLPARRADEVLEVVGLVSFREERLGTLSRGMDRRMGLACVLLSDPHTLVLDNPADGLSPRESRWLHGMLRAHATQGGTVLFTTADSKEAARTADRVVTLDRGTLVADQEVADFARNRLRPRVAVRSPHATRLAALLAKEARTAHRSVEIVREEGNRLCVYGSTCADVGEIAFRHGIPIHQLADEVGDMGPGAGAGVGVGAGPGTGAGISGAQSVVARAAKGARAAAAAPAVGASSVPHAGSATTGDEGMFAAGLLEGGTVPERREAGSADRAAEKASVTASEAASVTTLSGAASGTEHTDHAAPDHAPSDQSPPAQTPPAARVRSAPGQTPLGDRALGGGPDAQDPAAGVRPDAFCAGTHPEASPATARPEASATTGTDVPAAITSHDNNSAATRRDLPLPLPHSPEAAVLAEVEVEDAHAPTAASAVPARAETSEALPAAASQSSMAPQPSPAPAPQPSAASHFSSSTSSKSPSPRSSPPQRSTPGRTGPRPAGSRRGSTRAAATTADRSSRAQSTAGHHTAAQPSIPTPRPRPAEAVTLDTASRLPPPISVRLGPSPLRPLRYELRRASGVGTGFVTVAVVLVVSALTVLIMGRLGHTPQPRLLAAWPQQFPLPPAALGAGLLGAFSFGDEFRHPALAADRGTVPRRLGLLAAKLLVAGATALLIAFLTIGCDAEVLYLVYGRELTQVPGDWLWLGTSWIGLMVGCAWAGVLAAGLFRSTTAGLAAVLAVPVVVVPAVQKALGGAAGDATGLPARLRRTFLLEWPFGGDRYLAAAARVIAQPVGSALTLSLAALLGGYLVLTLRSRVR
ncbi:ATP-binding cassette domain-containing protein [Streptomyces sp. MK7]|uniref:ATP-binding cassette domain-containing protein n=1 Tax=Streptomyces sp. MK7 TaxID=3067635 RepID=UPI0029313CA6|nr:ATP-binding cassette domain-containing protein [Streptomyces sp. MK7]